MVCGLLMIGSIFKVMSLAGARILILISITVLNTIFLPSAFVSCYKAGGRKKKAVYLTAFIALFGIFTSALFKIMHWPGANNLIFVGMLLPVVLFLPVYLYFYRKEKDESIQDFLYIIFFMVGISGMATILAIRPSPELFTDAVKVCYASDISGFYQFQQEADQINQDTSVTNIQNRATTLLNKIKDLKTDLIVKSSQNNRKANDSQNQILFLKISNLEDQQLTGSAEYQNKMDHLILDVRSFQDFLSTFPDIKDSNSMEMIKEILPVEFRAYLNEPDGTDYFYDTHLIMTILQLTVMENYIRLAVSEALSEINPIKEM